MSAFRSKLINNGAKIIIGAEKFFRIDHPKLRVLAYHSVSDDNFIVDVSKNDFRSQIGYLRSKFNFVDLDQASAYLAGETVLSAPSVALTFDDGYKDLLENVFPVLKKYSIPAAVFVLAEPKKANRNELENPKPLLDNNDLAYLKKNGWTIGCHGMTHANFAGLSGSGLGREIIEAKKVLEAGLGSPIKYFSYPKGVFSAEAKEMCKSAGYCAAFTIDKCNDLFGKYNAWEAPRLGINRTHRKEIFPAILSKTADHYFYFKKHFLIS